jgi:hypothetical protein
MSGKKTALNAANIVSYNRLAYRILAEAEWHQQHARERTQFKFSSEHTSNYISAVNQCFSSTSITQVRYNISQSHVLTTSKLLSRIINE